MGLFVIFTLLSFYNHPVNISTVKSWLNQTVPKKAILATKLFFAYIKSKKVNEALKNKYTCASQHEKLIQWILSWSLKKSIYEHYSYLKTEYRVLWDTFLKSTKGPKPSYNCMVCTWETCVISNTKHFYMT